LATESRNGAIVRLLVEKGAFVNRLDSGRKTPLHLAAGAGNEAMVKLLVEKGADVDFQDLSGKTPLHLATESGNMAIVRFLLEKGANVAFQDLSGNAPLHLAAEGGNETMAQLVREHIALGDKNAGPLFDKLPPILSPRPVQVLSFGGYPAAAPAFPLSLSPSPTRHTFDPSFARHTVHEVTTAGGNISPARKLTPVKSLLDDRRTPLSARVSSSFNRYPPSPNSGDSTSLSD
jgi:hypothetical protein